MEIEHNLNETPWLQDLLTNGAKIRVDDTEHHISTSQDKNTLSVESSIGASMDVTATLSDDLKQTVRQITLNIPDITDSNLKLDYGTITLNKIDPERIEALEEILSEFCGNNIKHPAYGEKELFFEIHDTELFCNFLKHMETEDFKQSWDTKTEAFAASTPPTPEPPSW